VAESDDDAESWLATGDKAARRRRMRHYYLSKANTLFPLYLSLNSAEGTRASQMLCKVAFTNADRPRMIIAESGKSIAALLDVARNEYSCHLICQFHDPLRLHGFACEKDKMTETWSMKSTSSYWQF
jgi:hypothetical protein